MKRSIGPGALARGLGWLVLSGSLSIGLSGCAPRQTDPEEVRPEQAGQPLDPVRTVGRIASAHAAAITGNQDGLQRSMEGFSDDMRRAMKLPDPSRRINPEAARAAAGRVPGVRSVGWVDRDNLLVRVESADFRSQRMIDRICLELEPLGDTLAVVVNLQNAGARSGPEAQTLSRNCQLAPGDRSWGQRPRQMDVIHEDIRAQHRAAQEASQARGDREARREEARRILERSTPQM